jgi:ankyrin repeat protein
MLMASQAEALRQLVEAVADDRFAETFAKVKLTADQLMSFRNEYNEDLLSLAVGAGDVDATSILLEASVRPVGHDVARMTHLQLAIALPELDVRHKLLDLLLSHGADPNVYGHLGKTPLHNAIIARDRQSVEMLISMGADRGLPVLDAVLPFDNSTELERFVNGRAA